MPRLIDVDARRREIAQALWAVVVDEGLGAVSIRSVAARAEVSAGSLRHVFPTRADLVRHSSELMMARAAERMEAVPERDDPVDYAAAVLAELLPLDADRRTEMEVNTALIAESAQVPELVEIRDDAHDGIRRITASLVESISGVPDPESARRVHVLVDGMALHLLHRPEGADTGWATELLRAELEALRDAGTDVSAPADR